MAIGGAIVAVVGSVVASRNARRASERAAAQQQAAAQGGIDVQSEQFNRILELLGPSIEGGDLARQQQLGLLGLLGPEAQQAAQDQFSESPGQQFIRERQQRALTRNQAAIGGLGGGNIRTALQEQAAGFAQQDFGNQFNRLSALSGAGQTAATNIGQFGQQSAGNIGNLLGQFGQAGAAGIFGQAQARNQLVSNLSAIGASFSDSRLKKNINKIGKIGCLNVYEWTWKTTGLDDVGFLAEEVKQEFPDLVEEHNGFLRVHYNEVLEAA
jgi:hypothetical protein